MGGVLTMSVAVEVASSKLWNIPPLVRGAGLPEGFRLGALAVAQLRATEARCEVYLVTHDDGSSHMARVARRAALAEQPALADSMLAAAVRLYGHRHPNLLEVHGAGWTDEATPRPYVLHERVVGRDLASYQARHGSIDPSLLLAIGRQCAAGLAALHGLGLAHADLRRGSVTLVPAGGDAFRIKLGGFERARAIEPGAAADAEPLVAADLAALGAMLQELAAGAQEVPAALAELIARLTAEPTAASAAEVAARLAAIEAQVDPGASAIVAAGAEALPEREETARWSRRAPEFGQISLVMPIERPADPIRLARAPWLMTVILIVSAAAVMIVASLAGRSLGRVLEIVDTSGEETVLGRVEVRTVPDWIEPPRPVPVPELVASLAAAGGCKDEKPEAKAVFQPRKPETSGARRPSVAAVEEAVEEVEEVEEEVEEVAPMLPVDEVDALMPVGPAKPVAPAKPDPERLRKALEGLGMMPVDETPARAEAKPFLTTTP